MLGRSFIYNKKSNGPRTEPWGTPQLISNVSDDFPLIVTYCLRLVK